MAWQGELSVVSLPSGSSLQDASGNQFHCDPQVEMGRRPAQHLCLPMLIVTCYTVLEDMKHYEVLLLGMQLAQSVNGDVCSLEKILSKMSSSAHARHSLHGSDPG